MLLFAAEFIGTAFLLMFGMSLIIFFWGNGTKVSNIIPSNSLRRLISAFLFVIVSFIITMSPVGKISGAHLNPAVSFAFWTRGKMKFYAFGGYIISQMTGAMVGSVPLIYFWKEQGASIRYGATVPGPAGEAGAFIRELLATSAIISVIFLFVGSRSLRNYTPYAMPFVSAVIAWSKAFLSGCSMNPARSFGPAIVAEIFTGFWIYLLAPISGAFLVTIIFKYLKLHLRFRIEKARVSFHDHPTPDCLTTTS